MDSIYYDRLVDEFRKVTGWTKEQVKERIQGLTTNLENAINFYSVMARLPNAEESKFLNRFGFESWYNLHTRGFFKN